MTFNIQKKAWLVVAAAIFLSGNAKADFWIHGNVKATIPQRIPLHNAIVEVKEGARIIGKTTTNPDGTFSLKCTTNAVRQNPSHSIVIYVSHLPLMKGIPNKTWPWDLFNNYFERRFVATYGFNKPR